MAPFDTVDNVVKGYIDKFPERYQAKDYWPMLRHATSWFNQRDRVLAPSRATVQIMLQADRTAVLPDDYIDWLVVGKLVGGKVQNLGFNEKVSRIYSATPTPARPVQVHYDGWCGPDLFGYGIAPYPAEEFVIENGILHTNSEVEPGPLYLQYIYNPDKANERTVISSDYAMLLEYWIEWQMNRRAPDAATLMGYYYGELRKVFKHENPTSSEQLYNIFDNTAYGQ